MADRLPKDIWSLIIPLCNDQTSIALAMSCQLFRTYCQTFGYCRALRYEATDENDVIDFYEQFTTHRRTIEKVSTVGLDDPMTWIPRWPKETIITGTRVPEQIIDPLLVTKTRQLTWIDLRSHSSRTEFQLNPEKFPELETLTVVAWDINEETIAALPKIKFINLSLKVVRPLEIPDHIGYSIRQENGRFGAIVEN